MISIETRNEGALWPLTDTCFRSALLCVCVLSCMWAWQGDYHCHGHQWPHPGFACLFHVPGCLHTWRSFELPFKPIYSLTGSLKELIYLNNVFCTCSMKTRWLYSDCTMWPDCIMELRCPMWPQSPWMIKSNLTGHNACAPGTASVWCHLYLYHWEAFLVFIQSWKQQKGGDFV